MERDSMMKETITNPTCGRTVLLEYESIAEFALLSKKGVCGFSQAEVTFEQAKEFALNGKNSYAALGESFDLCAETYERVITKIPSGGRVVISDIINDSPTPCRRKVRHASHTAPLKIFVGVVTSAGTGQEYIEKRGRTILRLLQELQAERSVDLILYTEKGSPSWEIYTTITCETRPLNVSQVGYALCDESFPRRLDFNAKSEALGWDGKWPKTYYRIDHSLNRDAALGISQLDLHIPSLHLNDTIATSPEKWLQETLAKLRP
jgi:hypothetical protein